MTCGKCGTVYRDTDTWCVKCGRPLNDAAVVGGKGAAQPRRAGDKRWEYKTITVPLDLTYIPFSRSPREHRTFAEAYQRIIGAHLEREAREGWAVDGLAGWQSSLAAGRIKMPWWDRVQEFLGLDTPRHFLAVTIPLKRLTQTPAAAAPEPRYAAPPRR